MPKVDWSPEDNETSSGFEVLPKGRYLAVVEDSELKDTKAKTGKYFEFEFSVVKGDFKNRKLWARLNVHNPSETAQRIGREQYNALAKACGVEYAKQTEKLHGKMVVLIVDVKDSMRGDGQINEVTGFLAATEQQPEPRQAPRGEQRQAPAKKPASKPAGDDDDDIPF